MIETKLQLDSGRSSEEKMRRWVQKIISREEFSVTMFLTGQTDGETDRLLSYTCHLMISVSVKNCGKSHSYVLNSHNIIKYHIIS